MGARSDYDVRMTDVAEVLIQWGSDASEADVAAVLNNTFQAMPAPYAAVPSKAALAYLAEHGGPEAAETVASWSSRTEHQRRVQSAITGTAQLVAGMVSIDQAADRVGVDRSRISHFINDRPARLYAVKMGTRRRIPIWQLHGNTLLPGLDRIVPAIPDEAHPLDVTGVMTTPQDELGGRTPIEHLVEGGDVEPVTVLLSDLGRW